MKVLGISPLDKDATASLVEDGRVLFAAGEERFTRCKQQDGFPYKAIEAALAYTRTKPEEIDRVVYAFLPWQEEERLMRASIDAEREASGEWPDLNPLIAAAKQRVPNREGKVVPGLKSANQKMEKGALKETAYSLLGAGFLADRRSRKVEDDWIKGAVEGHQQWAQELEKGLRHFGLQDKLAREEHHLSHAANAYLPSGFDRALIVTIDGYGSGLAGSISLGEGGKITRLSNLRFPNSLGVYYEGVTSSLGFKPDRHAGKIVGLAAYGDPQILADVLMARVRFQDGTFHLADNLNIYLSRHLASEFPMIDVAAAYQHVLERIAGQWVGHWINETGTDAVVLSGGVAANVKLNQRLFEVPGVKHVFVYPNMGDGGCGTGLALHASWGDGGPRPVHDVYLGPDYSPAEIRAELEREGLSFTEPGNLAQTVAQAIAGNRVVARFGGRMEYGPRALGNRSILYHGRDPEVNQWLNTRLGRTEFMPFAPVTLWEARDKCYRHMAGAEHTAEFMTITFDCTEFMRQMCPAAVHVDNTARPQLIRREKNPEYYDILAEHEKLSGSPSIINTSFNMHEEPIVCSPRDAVRAFLDGRLDCLAIGPYFVG